MEVVNKVDESIKRLRGHIASFLAAAEALKMNDKDIDTFIRNFNEYTRNQLLNVNNQIALLMNIANELPRSTEKDRMIQMIEKLSQDAMTQANDMAQSLRR